MLPSFLIPQSNEVDAYIQHGFSLIPIPPNSKAPRTPGWNLRENSLKSYSVLPQGFGVGLAHAYSGTMALDIDDWTRAAGELLRHEIDIYRLFQNKESVGIDSGRKSHAKLLYKMPEGLVLPSKKLMDKTVNGIIYNYLDFRCSTTNGATVQDVLPPSIHPDTKQPYKWSGNGHWTKLPEIPEKLLNLWQFFLDRDKERVITNETSISSSWEEIAEALSFISPNCSRKEWIDVGMALHWVGSQPGQSISQAFSVWDDWSRTSELKYPGEKVMLIQWKSFTTEKDNTVTIGTLFHMAKSGGWIRHEVDAAFLFSKIDPPVKPSGIKYDFEVAPPAINLDLFPAVLATRAKQMSISVGCDPIVPLWAGLASACAVADARTRLELVQGFKVPPVLWLMTIGAPADKKTPGSTPMMSILHELQKEDLPRFKRDFLAWQAKEAQWSAQHKAWLDYNKSPEALISNNSAPELGELPPQPRALRLVVEDITSQKLVRNAAEHPRGILCYLDEMNSWVRKMVDKNTGEDRSAWARSYESQPYVMDRVGAGTIHCENLAVAMYGNIQPRVLRDNIKSLAADGLLHRFLPGILSECHTTYGNPIPEYLQNTAQWNSTLRTLFSMPALNYQLEPEAFKVFRNFQIWYEATRKDERLLCSSDNFMMAFGKLEGLVGRIALMFHLIENPYQIMVSENIMVRVVELVKSYIIPALRYTLGDMEGSATFDRWLKNHLLTIEEPSISAADIRTSGKKFLDEFSTPWAKHEAITRGMYILEVNRWVIRVDDKSKDHQGIASWIISPDLRMQFKDDREKVRKAVERRIRREQ